MTARSGVSLGAIADINTGAPNRTGIYIGDTPASFIWPRNKGSTWTYNQGTGYSPADLETGGEEEMINAYISTALTINVSMRDSATGQALTGATLVVQLKKAGQSSFSTITPTVTETGFGTYDIALTTTHLNTLGIAVLRVTAPGNAVGQPVGMPKNRIYVNVLNVNQYDSAWGLFPTGAVVANGGNSATSFATNRSESVADYWKLAFLVFTSGNLKGQVKQITGFTVTNAVMSFTSPGFTGTPTAGDTFYIINA